MGNNQNSQVALQPLLLQLCLAYSASVTLMRAYDTLGQVHVWLSLGWHDHRRRVAAMTKQALAHAGEAHDCQQGEATQ